jgi:hypothetical protein
MDQLLKLIVYGGRCSVLNWVAPDYEYALIVPLMMLSGTKMIYDISFLSNGLYYFYLLRETKTDI